MNILTHPVHTGYQFELARTGHEFYSLHTPGSGEIFWDVKSRPQPRNFHSLARLADAPVNFDLILVHYESGYHHLKHLNLPLIYKDHCICPPFHVAPDWIQRISYYSFASQAAASSWIAPEEFARRKVIIGTGIDVDSFGEHTGADGDLLVVGHEIACRGNSKGYENLVRLAHRFRITVVGRRNDRIPGAIGPAGNYEHLLRLYQTHKVFLNPSNLFGMSTLEAMAAGMPIVSFRMLNSDVLVNEVNSLLVESVEEAEIALRRLLADASLRFMLGKNARATARSRFSSQRFVQRWNKLFCQAVYEYHPDGSRPQYKPFDIASKPERERRAAESVIHNTFEYRRIGYDQRIMTFLPDGRVDKGAAACELFWDVKSVNGDCFLEISTGSEITCRLKLDADDSWKGRWNYHEKMPIVLTPLKAINPKTVLRSHSH